MGNGGGCEGGFEHCKGRTAGEGCWGGVLGEKERQLAIAREVADAADLDSTQTPHTSHTCSYTVPLAAPSFANCSLRRMRPVKQGQLELAAAW